MPRDTRNARVVGLLVGSMTLTAAVLLAIEPRRRAFPADGVLAASTQTHIDELVIEYLPPGLDAAVGDYDCIVLTDAEVIWQPSAGPMVRMLVAGSPSAELNEAQQRAVLSMIGRMKEQLGLDLGSIRLHPDSDPRLRFDLPPQAQSLLELLLRKGLVQ